MRCKRLLNTFVIVLLSVVAVQTASADPCGMVPPIYPGQEIPLARIGLQQTYVYYKGGVETFVIRPGFTGKVDEFGMLIPFPTPPAIRKVPDHVFEHLAAAVDPPEVVVDLRFRPELARASSALRNQAKGDSGLKYRKDEVKVLKEEAVGMYEVAVLEAGSAAALQRWMDDHGYRYPTGMDKACQDYVEERWCFVAVKTKVGQKKGIDPQPGQRDVESKLPAGSTFDGYVQAMGFRFMVDELVVPMRLSSFNEGELRNVVYLVTDGPRKIRLIPEEYVVRQLPGDQIIKNVTQPLPLRIIGGSEKDIPEYIANGLPQQRDPTPKNGAAKELFASDLLATETGELALPHEEREKELLRIGERFGLRGPDIDKLNNETLIEERDKIVEQSLGGMNDMTLTVVDGDFPRELLARQNLTFAHYQMPSGRNRPEFYDAKVNGPAPKQEGILKVGALTPTDENDAVAVNSSDTAQLTGRIAWVVSVLALAVIGLTFVARWTRGRRRTWLVLLIFAVSLTAAPLAFAQDKKEDAEKPTIRQLLNQLSDGSKAESALEALVARGDEAKEQLMGEALEGNDLARRGWAIVALSEIGGKDVDEHLAKVHGDGNQPMLIRTWAAAARVYMTDSTDGLVQKAELAQQFPAVGRPLGMRLVDSLGDKEKPASPEGLLSVSLRVPQLQQALAPAILALGSEKLVSVMTTAKDQQVRYQATAYLGTLAVQGDKKVAPAVVNVYKFDPQAEQVPWNGGPLYLPGIQWDKEQGTKLVGNLIAWHLWCDRNGKGGEQQQINNNLNSITLANVVGYQFGANDTVTWLTNWGKVVGRKEIERMLKEQGADDVRKYSSVLEQL